MADKKLDDMLESAIKMLQQDREQLLYELRRLSKRVNNAIEHVTRQGAIPEGHSFHVNTGSASVFSEEAAVVCGRISARNYMVGWLTALQKQEEQGGKLSADSFTIKLGPKAVYALNLENAAVSAALGLYPVEGKECTYTATTGRWRTVYYLFHEYARDQYADASMTSSDRNSCSRAASKIEGALGKSLHR